MHELFSYILLVNPQPNPVEILDTKVVLIVSKYFIVFLKNIFIFSQIPYIPVTYDLCLDTHIVRFIKYYKKLYP